jgi:hypothetical protein
VSALKSIIDLLMSWLADNARSFSYMLPDAVELALYLGLAVYFGAQLVAQQAGVI